LKQHSQELSFIAKMLVAMSVFRLASWAQTGTILFNKALTLVVSGVFAKNHWPVLTLLTPL
jgi:uracil DNA glycosylase